MEAEASTERPSPALGETGRAILAGALAMAGLTAYLNVRPEQYWILALTALIAAATVESSVRNHPDWQGNSVDALGHALLPLLAVLGAGLFIDETVEGYGRVAAGLVAGAATGGLTYAASSALSAGQPLFGPMRLALTVITYLTALTVFTVFSDLDLDLPTSTAAVGLVSMALAYGLLRESRGQGLSPLLGALAIGISFAELRNVLYFFPLDALLTGALMIIAFYVATALVHHLIDDDLTPSTVAEYVVVASISAAVVIVARQLL